MKPFNFLICLFVSLFFFSEASGGNFPLWGNLQRGKSSAGAISELIYIPPLTDIRIYGEAAPGLLFAPVTIPVNLEILMRRLGTMPAIFNASQARLLFFVFFNWLWYGIMIYMFLGRLKRFGKQDQTSPPPPMFVES